MKKNYADREKAVLQALNDCARAFLESHELKHSFSIVYGTCKKLIGATAGYAALLNANESGSNILFYDMGSLSCDLDTDTPMPIRGLLAAAYSSRKGVYENDLRHGEWLKYLPDGHGRLENVLFVPLVNEDKAVGVLGFANKPGGFDDDDLLVVQAVADQATVGLMKNRTLNNLENNVKHFKAMMLTANDAIITVDQEGKIFWWNHTAEKYFGYLADEIVGRSCTKIIPASYVHAHQAAFEKAVRTGASRITVHQVEVEALNKDGDTFPVELSVSKWEADHNIFFTAIVRDITSRRRIEKDLKLSERRLREIFKLMNSGGGLYKAVDNGNDFIILEYYRPSHLEKSEGFANLAGRRFLDVFPASREYGLFNVFKRVWRTGRPEYHPVTMYDSTGQIKSWRTNYVYKLSTDEIVAIYEDVTEKKQLEKNLRENENLFRSIFETSPDPINLNRLDDGIFIQVNSKFLELTGYSRREVIGRTAREINIWKDLGRRQQFFELLLNTWQVKDFEVEFKRKDGKILTALVSANLLSFQNKPHILAVSRDITELKKTEKALRRAHAELEKRYEVSTERLKESEIKYSSLVEALLTGVYMCVEGKIVFVNRQFCEMFGFTRDELLGMDMMNLVHPDDRADATPICRLTKLEETSDGGYEVRGLTKDGEGIYLAGRNTAVDFNGQQAILGNVANISRRIEAERERQRSEEGLRILSEALLSAEEGERKRIASDIHDSIGQTLSAIKFSVESSLLSINEQSLNSARKALEKVIPLTQQSIDEVRRIIMDLRPSMLDDLGLVATISWFCRDFESVYHDIRVERQIDVAEADIPPNLKTVIYRILQEALNNAAKHSRTEYILLKLLTTENFLELTVEDKGVGFDPEMTEMLNGNPRGMGLASIKERVSMSGGFFQIFSAPGIGTRIRIQWPLMTGTEE